MKDNQPETIHARTVVTIQSSGPSDQIWVFQAFSLTETEVQDMASLVRQVVTNFTPLSDDNPPG